MSASRQPTINVDSCVIRGHGQEAPKNISHYNNFGLDHNHFVLIMTFAGKLDEFCSFAYNRTVKINSIRNCTTASHFVSKQWRLNNTGYYNFFWDKMINAMQRRAVPSMKMAWRQFLSSAICDGAHTWLTNTQRSELFRRPKMVELPNSLMILVRKRELSQRHLTKLNCDSIAKWILNRGWAGLRNWRILCQNPKFSILPETSSQSKSASKRVVAGFTSRLESLKRKFFQPTVTYELHRTLRHGFSKEILQFAHPSDCF